MKNFFFSLLLICCAQSSLAATNWLSLSSDTVPAPDDEVISLDVSDTTMHVSGTVKRVLLKDLHKRTSRSLSASDSVTTDDFVIFADATSGAITLSLYTPVGNKDRTIQVHKEDGTSNDVTLTGTGDELPAVLNLENSTVTLQSDGTEWHKMQQTPIIAPSYKSETFISEASGTYYVFGFYSWNAADANLTQAAPTTTIGTANISAGAHAGIVAAAAGTASGGTGAVEIEVSGTSITDAGVETTSDTAILVADITALSANEYVETSKKWTGVVTYTLQNAAGSTQTTFAVDVNYGLAAYEDRANRDFTVSDLSAQITGGATDTGFEMELLHHKITGWTYAATGFVPGDGAIATFTTDSPTNNDLASGAFMRWKRDNLTTAVNGSGEEGYLMRLTTAQNNSVRIGNIAVGVEF